MIRVVLAEDHHVVRQGIRALLEQTEDIEVVGEVEDGQAAVDVVQRLAPDVLVLDIGMPRLNGIQATAQVRTQQPATQVVILSMYSDETLVRQALRSGARGYLLKRSATEELLLAIRAASRGEIYLSPAITDTVLADFLAQPAGTAEPELLDRLSPRESQVLQLIAEGRTNSEIAQIMQVAVKTVEKHRANLMAKLKVHDVAGLVRVAIKHGLIFLDQ